MDTALGEALAGILHVYVAFDLGNEVNLDAAKQLVSAEYHRLPRQARTPPSIAYEPSPLRFEPEPVPFMLAELGAVTASVDVTVFDFAGASVGLHVPFQTSAAALIRLAGSLADPAPFIQQATEVMQSVWGQIRPAIQAPRLIDLTEEYFVFQFLPEPPLPAVDKLLTDQAQWLAALVRLDPARFAAAEIEEALRLRISYSPSDLVIADWAAAVVVDRDCGEILETIAFANLQLLQLRHIDRRLGERLQEAYLLMHTLTKHWLPFWRSYARPLRILGAMKVDANQTIERSGNALKFIGDQYLSRLYQLVSARLHLEKWTQSVRDSLRILEGIYQVVADQAATVRNEVLEWIIILLIFFEIVMTFFGR
jgi:hypothetical protein